MAIENTYIVNIDFDGDMANRYNGKSLIFTELDEVKKVIIEALSDLLQCELNHNCIAGMYVGERWYPTSEVLSDDALLEKFIEYGHMRKCHGHRKIDINKYIFVH